jgi:hypothetical protein
MEANFLYRVRPQQNFQAHEGIIDFCELALTVGAKV